MGWLWMCLGIRDNSARRIRANAGGRVSSDTFDSRPNNLAPQFDIAKTPRIEDYLQPGRAGYDVFVSEHPSESPSSIKSRLSTERYADGDYEEDLRAHALESINRAYEETHFLRVGGRARRNKKLGNEKGGEYGPYWGYAADASGGDLAPDFEYARVTPSSTTTRKSFSELLIETDALDSSTSSKGPLALAAMAAVAERAARSLRLQEEGKHCTSSSFQSKEVPIAEGPQKIALNLSRNNSGEALAKERAETKQDSAGGRNLPDRRQEGRIFRAQTGFDEVEAYERPPQSPQSPPSMPLLTASSVHDFPAADAVAAFKESRRQLRISDSSSSTLVPVSKPSSSRPNVSISSFFRSSRKRSLPFMRSRLFRIALSPVPEVLSHEEELRSKRQSDVNPRDLHQFFCNSPNARGWPDENASSSSTMEPTFLSLNSKDSVTSSEEQQLGGKEVQDAELATGVASCAPLTEEWDDFVLVERPQEIPTLRVQEDSEDVDPGPDPGRDSGPGPGPSSRSSFGSSSSSDSFITFTAVEQRDEDVCEDQGRDAANCIDGRNLDVGLHSFSSSSTSEGGSREDEPRGAVVQTTPSNNTPVTDYESLQEDDALLRTPIRDPLVTPEVFISPKTTNAELKFTSVMDMDPEDRPIFGSLADHWEAAWASKRSAWDGKGIPNSTNKYREDQKVRWQATPFEERLAQALATQREVPQRRNRFKGAASRLAAGGNDTGLQAH